MPPKVLSKGGDRPSGVLAVSAAARAAPKKVSTARLKLEIRRLPPGLTLSEFEDILGPEWKLGSGRVDWREYRQGKVKSALGKVPEQSRCYVHLVAEAMVKDFEARFLNIVFHDKAGTHRNPDLRHLPPTLGFAPNQRTPLNTKVKTDSRQGTIDQDPEFIRFLEAETQPITKPAALDAVGVDKEKVEKPEIASTTPLIEAIREKKANKAKAAAAKEEKRDAKGHAKTDSKDAVAIEKSTRDVKAVGNPKAEQVPKEVVKAVNKNVALKQQQPRPASPQQTPTKTQASPAKAKKDTASPKPATAKAATSSPASGPTPSPLRAQRQRGNPDTIKKMFQKDLGIKPKATPTVGGASSPSAPSTSATTTTPAVTKVPNATPQPNTTPVKATSVPKQPVTQKQSTQTSQPISATKAYLKHANPSQGMTEALVQQGLAQFGDVTSVNIDPKKGTAVAVFKDADGLKKALEGKKIPIANGTLEIHEFRERGQATQGTRGGAKASRGGARGGKGNAPGAPSAAPPVSAASSEATK